jgi:hypothetical protein
LKITYLPQQNIDKQKWDRCIENASNGLIYAWSFYLDAMSKNWDALVLNDYEAVMPLTWNKKYGIYYLYQPFFVAHLGVFGNDLSPLLVQSFLENIPLKFRYWDFNLNERNLFAMPGFKIFERSNYILSLEKSYEELYSFYTKSHQRNIRKAKNSGNIVKKNIPVTDVIFLAKQQTRNFSPVTDKDYKKFSGLFTLLQKRNMAVTYGVYTPGQQLISSCGWLISQNRTYYILVGNHPKGRDSGASHLMIDYFISEHAGKNLLLDFEGSDIKSLAWFYKGFGAIEQKYPGIKLNKLPSILKLVKK